MKKIILALGFAGLMAFPAIAQETDFATVDANGDGQVTLDEAVAAGWDWSTEDFQAADTNGDGTLDADEFAAATQ